VPCKKACSAAKTTQSLGAGAYKRKSCGPQDTRDLSAGCNLAALVKTTVARGSRVPVWRPGPPADSPADPGFCLVCRLRDKTNFEMACTPMAFGAAPFNEAPAPFRLQSLA